MPRPEQKKVVVILNGISLQKKRFYDKFLPALQSVANVTVKETLTRHDAINLASKATEEYVDAIIAAGGDGTLNQVLNGVLTGREKDPKLPAIGLIPLGSGNDFARTVKVPRDPEKIKNLIAAFDPVKLDVGEIRFETLEGASSRKYFINVADIGMGPEVVKKVNESSRAWGHAVAYYKSILSTFLHYKPMMVVAKDRDWEWKGKLRTLAIGNGKCYGHGLHIAPDAIPNDRVFNVFICGGVSVLDFIRHSRSLKQGKFIRIPKIEYKKTISVELESEGTCLIEGDGEIFGKLPATVKLIDRQLDFLA